MTHLLTAAEESVANGNREGPPGFPLEKAAPFNEQSTQEPGYDTRKERRSIQCSVTPLLAGAVPAGPGTRLLTSPGRHGWGTTDMHDMPPKNEQRPSRGRHTFSKKAQLATLGI